jgi:putative phosphonate metabolism protein
VIPPGGRVGLYYAPAEDDPLSRCASAWLGRDAASGAVLAQPDLPDIAAITANPRMYGFHATLKPPMRLRTGVEWGALLEVTGEIAAGVAPFDLPRLAVADLHGFLALRETVPSPELQALADICVAGADALREPPDEAELARRRRNGLPPAQEKMLTRWGYPYVFATWFFHMTLTRRLTAAEHAIYRPAAEAFVAEAVAQPRRVVDICLFVQAAPGAPFILRERVPLRG